MLTKERLEAIRQRAEKATQGPWYLNNEILLHGEGPYDYICEIDAEKDDADFIIHAREDIPALLAEVERLRNEISFIANVDMSRAYDAEHVAISVKSWALNVLEGGKR